MGTRNLEKLFRPDSVAVIGASPKEGSAGGRIVSNLLEGGFKGPIYPINPNYTEIMGLATYPDISSLDEKVDLAVVAVRIELVPEIIREIGACGVPCAIVIAVGGAEAGPEGKKLEEEIYRTARDCRVRVMGPNSLGIILPHHNLNASLAPHHPIPGQVAFVSQSGAMCYSVLDRSFRDNLGFSHFISIGNMADVGFGDVLDHLTVDTNVRSIILYLETLKDFRGFMSAARAASRKKPIIALKAGIGTAGRVAAASHTGAMTSEDVVFDAAFRRAGIIRVMRVGQILDCARALAKQPLPLGSRLGVVTNAGGPGVLAVDALFRWGVEPAALSKETLGALDEVLPKGWSRGNPVDMLGFATPEHYEKAVKILMDDPRIDGLVAILSPQFQTLSKETAQVLARSFEKRAKPLFAVWMGHRDVQEGMEILRDAGISAHESPERAVDAFMYMVSYSKNLELLMETPAKMPKELTYNHQLAQTIINKALEKERHLLTETESKAILSAYGIPVNPTETAKDEDTAAARARSLGYPVALKVLSRDISHKTQPGGVRLNLTGDGEVKEAFKEIMDRVERALPEARVEGVTVQTMVKDPDHELILGSTTDRGFGPVLMFGAGGVAARFLRDRAYELPPLNRHLARRFMEKTGVFKMLAGASGHAAANIPLLEEILIRLSCLVTDFPEIRELDINPLLVKGDLVLAVDSRMVVAPAGAASPLHLSISPYPDQYETNWVMDDGTPVLIRPIRPEDEPLMKETLESLSEESSYLRFFRVLRDFSHERLAHLTQIDYDRELALVAVTQPPFKERIVGETRLIHELTGRAAEFAIFIADAWQGKGLGKKMLEMLIEVGKARGLESIKGLVMPENVNMIRLCEKLGFCKSYKQEYGAQLVEIYL